MINAQVSPAITESYRHYHDDKGLDHMCWFHDGVQTHQARIVCDRLFRVFGENRLVVL